MVSKNTSKVTSRYTYAERALSAVYHLQTKFKKSSVHLASVRSQVKKAALSKNDRLGPHMNAWVRRAIGQLKQDDLLELSDAAGSITLSPNGKKVMSEARRSLGITGPLTPDQEDRIVKQVTQQSRKRSLDSPGSNLRKRVRTSHSGGVARTKVKLQAELQQMRRARDQVQLELKRTQRDLEFLRATREMSPLTDLDDDEQALHMQEDFDSEDQESQILQQSQHNDASSDLDVLTRPSTPVSPSSFFTSPPERPSLANMVNNSKSPLGMTRTQSGSLLSILTRRPTPAPSSPGSDYGIIDDFPMTGADNVVSSSDSSRDSRTLRPGQLATPEPTPSRPGGSSLPTSLSWQPRGQGLRDEIEELRNISVQNANREARERVSHEEIRTFSDEFSREAQVQAQATQLANSNTQLALLQSANARLTEEVSEKTARTDSLRVEIEQLRQEKANAESVHDGRVAELEASVARLESVSVDAVQQVSALTASLSENVKETKGLRRSLEAKEEELVRVTEQLRQVNEKLESQMRELASALKDVTDKQAALGGLQHELADVRAQKDLLSAQLDELNAASQDLAVKLSASEHLAELHRQDILAEEEELGRLRSQMKTLESSMEDASAAAVAQEAEKVRLEMEADTQKAAITNLETSLASAEGRVTTLQAEIEMLKAQCSYVGSQLNEVKSDKQRLDGELEVERSQRGTLENQLRDAEMRTKEADEEIEELRVSKEADVKTIQKMKEKFAELHQVQMRQLEDIGREFENSSPTPAHRRPRPTL